MAIKCPHCSMKMSTERNLKIHITKKHKAQAPAVVEVAKPTIPDEVNPDPGTAIAELPPIDVNSIQYPDSIFPAVVAGAEVVPATVADDEGGDIRDASRELVKGVREAVPVVANTTGRRRKVQLVCKSLARLENKLAGELICELSDDDIDSIYNNIVALYPDPKDFDLIFSPKTALAIDLTTIYAFPILMNMDKIKANMEKMRRGLKLRNWWNRNTGAVKDKVVDTITSIGVKPDEKPA